MDDIYDCQENVYRMYRGYKKAPHLTFLDTTHSNLSPCLSSGGTLQYHENRKEYIHKVKTYNYNDYICKEFQQQQMDLLWKEAHLLTKLRIWFA
jgi:hypothetical protein